MSTDEEGLVPEVREIVTAVLGDLSLEQAATRTKQRPGKEGIRTLKRGKVGREETARGFAEGFWKQICELYAEQIQERFGECSQKTASDWFAGKCGFGFRYSHSNRPALTYEPDFSDINVAGFRGAENLPPEDIDTINTVVRDLIAARRRARGLD